MLPASARAGDKTIVLLDVEGEQAPRLRKALERMIKTQHEILPSATYRDAARRLRAKKLTPNNVKKVCAYLKVDGVIDGTVVQDDQGYKLIVRLRSASTGIIQKKFPLRLVEPRLPQDISDKLAERLLLAVDNLQPVDKDGQDGTRVAAARTGRKGDSENEEAEGAEDEELTEVKGKGKGKGTAAASARRSRSTDPVEEEELEEDVPPERVASDDGESSSGDGDSGDGDSGDGDSGDGDSGDDLDGSVDDRAQTTQVAMSPRTTPLLVNAGLSFIGRKLTFSYSGPEGEAPAGFSGTQVPGLYLVGEVYPAAFQAGKRGILADIGLGIIIDRVIKLNSSVDDGSGMGTVKLSTRMWRYGANLRYRHNFDAEPNGYSVQASLGFTTAGFNISKADAPDGVNVDVPNVGYKYLDLGAGGRVPIFGKLSFLAEAKLLAPLSTGEIQETTQYGPATVMGFDGELAFEYQFLGSFMARAGARLMLIKFSFDGDGALDDRDENGEDDVSGASDRYLGGFLTAGYWF